jgi:hypothetical protein
LVIGFINTLYNELTLTSNTALSLIYTISVTHSLGLSIFTSRILVTELKTVTKSSNHTLSLHRLTSNSSGHSAIPLELRNSALNYADSYVLSARTTHRKHSSSIVACVSLGVLLLSPPSQSIDALGCCLATVSALTT